MFPHIESGPQIFLRPPRVQNLQYKDISQYGVGVALQGGVMLQEFIFVSIILIGHLPKNTNKMHSCNESN